MYRGICASLSFLEKKMHNPVNDKRVFKPLPLGLNSEYDRWLVSPKGTIRSNDHNESIHWLQFNYRNSKRVLSKYDTVGFRIVRNR